MFQTLRPLRSFTILCAIPVALLCSCLNTQILLAAEPEIQVKLFQAHPDSDSIFISRQFEISKPQDQRFSGNLFKISLAGDSFEITELKGAIAAKKRFRSSELAIKSTSDRPLRVGRNLNNLRAYRGTIKLQNSGNKKIDCFNKVKIKDYVRSVVGSETPPSFPLEALKAQSVLIQTSMLRYKRGDALNDTTEKQAYLGADYERPEVVAAVEKTWGERLIYGKQNVPIYFHSTCAGSTSSSEIFTGKFPHMACDKSVICNYCKASPFFKDTVHHIPLSIYKQRIPEGIPKIIRLDKAGRALEVQYADGSKETGYAFWMKLGARFGWDKAPGLRFSLMQVKNGTRSAATFGNSAGISTGHDDAEIEIRSTGAGHGVGMCQWGAQGLALEGKSAERILQYYFPGSKIFKE